MTNLELQKEAVKVRKGIIDGVHAAKAGHPGGSLSAAEVFTYLYFEEMNVSFYLRDTPHLGFMPHLRTEDISQ